MKPEAEEETQAQTPVMKRFDDLSAREQIGRAHV